MSHFIPKGTAGYGFFSTEEGVTATGIVRHAFAIYDARMREAFEELTDNVGEAVCIENSGGSDTAVRESLAYRFERAQQCYGQGSSGVFENEAINKKLYGKITE